MALVDVEVVDANGNRCPTAHNLIHFKLDGAAEWRGGIAQGSAVPVPKDTYLKDQIPEGNHTPTPLLHEDNYVLASTLPVENGINRVILRSFPKAGKIHLHAEADGLKAADVELISLPDTAVDGLSTTMPDAALPSNLQRGPTPSTPSFKQLRFPVDIASISAGANSANAVQSMDDDDSTSWSSDGKLEDGWIEYVFASSQTPVQVDLKLGNFRQQSYPLLVTVDGKPVWQGMTPTNLGYCTLTLKPVAGTHLRIALTGSPIHGNEFGQIKELAGDAAPQVKQERPILAIAEAEIYKATP
jgi:hypothetical protein